MAMAHLIIGARGTKLALSQYHAVKTKLERLHPGLLVGFELAGAEHAEAEAFQTAATTALLGRHVDAALHDLRDLPSVLPPDFHLAAVNERVEAREALVVRADWQAQVISLAELPAGARIGINSATRRAQLSALGRGWQLCELGAPLETRLQQLDAGAVDALLVALIDLWSLGEPARALVIEPEEILPVAGQGALALQTRLEDQRTNLLLEGLNHWPTRYATEAERAVAANLPDAQHLSVAALARLSEADEDGPQLLLTALVAGPEGQRLTRHSRRGPLWQGELLGSELALELKQTSAQSLNAAGAQTVTAELFPEAQIQERPALPLNGTADTAKPQPLTEPAFASALASAAGLSSATPLRQPVSAFAEESVQEFDLAAAKARRVREQKPFYAQRLLIARATRHNAELVNLLETLGATVSVCPTARLSEPASWEPLDRALLHLSWYEWLTFVSAPGVTYFLKHFDELGHHRSEIEARRLCAVGAQAAAALRAADIQCDLLVEQDTAESLAAAVLKPYGLRARSRGTTMLLIVSQSLDEELRPALNKLGVYAEAVAAYQLNLPVAGGAEALAALRDGSFNYVICNGAASVENLATLAEPQTLPVWLGETRVLCTNEEAGAAAQAHGLTVHLRPSESSVSGLVRALREDCLSNQCGSIELF